MGCRDSILLQLYSTRQSHYKTLCLKSPNLRQTLLILCNLKLIMSVNVQTITFDKANFNSCLQDNNIHIGFDREYDSVTEPVCTQLYVKGFFPQDISNYSLFEDLLGIRIIASAGTVFIFDDSKLSPGVKYCSQFSSRLLQIQKFFSFEVKSRVICYTFYSNAELSAFFCCKKDLKEIIQLQGDTINVNQPMYSRNRTNLFFMDISGTIILKNYRYKLPFFVDIIDAKHIFTQSNLKDLGMSLQISKVEGFDFEKKKASE